jgi:hypothetical protein
MSAVDQLLEQAKRLSPTALRELRDRLTEALAADEQTPSARKTEGPYAALLRSAGTAHGIAPDVARNKNKHLAEIYEGKRRKNS